MGLRIPIPIHSFMMSVHVLYTLHFLLVYMIILPGRIHTHSTCYWVWLSQFVCSTKGPFLGCTNLEWNPPLVLCASLAQCSHVHLWLMARINAYALCVGSLTTGLETLFPKVWYTTPSSPCIVFPELEGAASAEDRAIRSSSFSLCFFFPWTTIIGKWGNILSVHIKTFFSQHTKYQRDEKAS